MPEVIGSAHQRGGELRRGEDLPARLPQHMPQRGRQVDATSVGLEQPTIRRGAVLLDVLAEHGDQHGRDRHPPNGIARAALGLAGLVNLAVVGPITPGRRTDFAELQQAPSPLGKRALI